MNALKRLLLGGLFVLSFLGTFILLLAATLRMEQGPAERHWELKIPDSLPLQLMNEQTGELTRTVHNDAKTGRAELIEVGYKDGRLGSYFFDKGRLSRYQSFEADKTLRYEAEYDATGALLSYRFLRKDGTQETVYRRNLSGAEELSFFDSTGLCVKSVVTASDGSQTVSVRDSNGKVTTTSTDASASEKQYFPVQTEEGTLNQLKIQVQGVRVKSWEYRNKDGVLLHSGKFTSDGDIELSIYSPSSKPVIRQTWTCYGEDWTRRYYRLSTIRQLDGSGDVATEVKLQVDGKTPLEVSSFYNGKKNNTNFYDGNGYHYRTGYYDYNGSPTTSYEIPPQYRRQGKFSPLILGEPTDGKQPVYRLRGTPYSTEPAEGGNLPPLFISSR